MKKKYLSIVINFTIFALLLGAVFWCLILFKGWDYLFYSSSFNLISFLWIFFVSLTFVAIHTKVRENQSYSLKSRALWQAPLVFLFGLTGIFFFSAFVFKTLLGPDFWSVLSSLPTQCSVKIPFLSLVILFPGTLFIFFFIFIYQLKNLKLKMDISKITSNRGQKIFSPFLITLVIACFFVVAALTLPDRIHFYFTALSYQDSSKDVNTREYLENFLKYYNDSKLADPVRFMLSRVLIRTFNMPSRACKVIEPLITKASSPFKDDALFEYAYIKYYELNEKFESEIRFKSFLTRYPDNPLKNNAIVIMGKITGETSEISKRVKILKKQHTRIYDFNLGSGIKGIKIID